MKSCFVILLVFLLFNLACNNSNRDVSKEKDVIKKTNTTHHKPSSGFTDTLKVTSPSAIFFKPDSLQWQQIKLVNDTMVYTSFEHDCFYQMRNAGNVIKQYFPAIKIIEAFKVRYLSFKLATDSTQYIDLDAVNDPCGIFLFDPNKKPHPADMMNIETELGFYFK
jgi:hypothetical protein